MKKNYTHISIVLDRSGSMCVIKQDTIGGFNEFLSKQKKEDGECTFTLVQFNHEYELVHDFIQLKDIPDLNDETFQLSGATALLDAIGKTIDSVGKKLSDMDEKDRPERVLFVIITDGQENSSQDFQMKNINEMIQHQTDSYNWQFIFLGANQDAIASAANIGIKKGNSLSFGATAHGVRGMTCSLNDTLTMYRGMSSDTYAETAHQVDAFTEEDRKIQEKEIAKTTNSTS